MGWSTLKLGAGGQISGIDIASDGTMVARADTYGAYWWNGSAWVQLYNANSISGAVVADPYSFIYGTYEIRIAPSNTSRFYMYNYLNIYTTTNKGASWTTTTFNNGLTVNGADGSDNNKFFGPFLAIDPFNELICYTGTPGHAFGGSIAAQGVFYTTDGGTTWTHISTATIAAGTTIPTFCSQDGGNLIAFDPTSSHPGSPPVTQTIYVSSYGTGVYKTTNGGQSGGTWTLLNSAGMPTNVKKMYVGPDSKLYCLDYLTANIIVYDGASWASFSTGTGYTVTALAFDPANANHLVVTSQDGTMSTSTTGVAGFVGYQTGVAAAHRAATDISWLGQPYGDYMTSAAIVFDPTQSNVLYNAAGVGVWKTSNTTITTPASDVVNWTSQSVGIEQLVTTKIISPPNGSPLVSCFDRPVFTISNIASYPSSYGPSYTGTVFEGYSVDYASATPGTVVAFVSNAASGNLVGVSSVGGGGPANWNYTTIAPVQTGTVAATASWTTATPNITMTTNPGWVVPKMFVTDVTTGFFVGTVLSYIGTALVLTANAATASAGSADNLTFFSGSGGCIAAASSTNFLAATIGTGLYYTTNAGASTWLAPTITGGAITNTDAGWSTFKADLKIQNVCADRVLANTFYAYNLGATAPGMYVSTDSGATFTKVFTGHVDALDGPNFQMRSVPGQSGNFYSACGGNSFSNVTPFDEWTWNGSTLTRNTIANVKTVWSFGFGKVKPGNSYPSIYVYGKVGSTVGLFRSDDHCATWTQLASSMVPDWPPGSAGSIDQVTTVEGDANTYGTVYVGFEGSGAAYFALDVGVAVYGFSVITDSGQRRTRMIGY